MRVPIALPAVLAIVVFSQCVLFGDTARILGLFPSFSKSHLIVHMATIRPMIERGHDVTVVTTIPLKEPVRNFRHIQLDVEVPEFSAASMNGSANFIDLIKEAHRTMLGHTNQTINDPKMQQLMREESFDLVVLGYFFNDFLIGVADHFKCPLILNWMALPLRLLKNYVANPSDPFYVPETWLGLAAPMGFFDRVKNFLFSFFERSLPYLLHFFMEPYYTENFPPDKYRSYDEMRRNVSMLFINSFLNQGPIYPTVPALVQIGGIQIKPKPDPLPEDIKKHLDTATNGAIFFSLGSNLDSKYTSPEFMKRIFNVLSKLKYKVIFKWNPNAIPGKSSNILYKDWLPQDDILAHPNIRLFITHAGAGGVAEAHYHGVPMVAIPFFADQPGNANSIKVRGHGVSLEHESLTEEEFHKAIMEVLENASYRENVQQFSRIFRDRPMSARDTAAYWMEYVIRHKGAKHLQSPAVHMSTVQLYGLDIFAFLAAVCYLFVKLVCLVWRKVVCKLFRMVFGPRKSKPSDKKKMQ